MADIKFRDYLDEQLKDPVFRDAFETERAKLEKAITLNQAREQPTSQSAIARITRDNDASN